MTTIAQGASAPISSLFSFDSQPVRITQDGDELWFVAQDVMSSLEYANTSKPSKVVEHVPLEWKGVKPIHTPGGQQQMLCISEPGLYFFLGRSDKPKALPFQKWLAGEVLPAIRKTGRYQLPAAQSREYLDAAQAAWLARLRAHLQQIAVTLYPEPEGVRWDERMSPTGVLRRTRAGAFVRDFEHRLFYELRISDWRHFGAADCVYFSNQLLALRTHAAALLDERADLEGRYLRVMLDPKCTTLPRRGTVKPLVRGERMLPPPLEG